MDRAYRGPERRRHCVYVTRNTEYHFRDEVCVAVRDLRTGDWLDSHLAMRRRLSGGVRLLENGSLVPTCEPPAIGEALYFGDGGCELITSTLKEIERPNRRALAQYAEAQ